MEKDCIWCGSKNTGTYEAQFTPFLRERAFNGHNIKTKLMHCLECDLYYSSHRLSDVEYERIYKNYRDTDYQMQRQKYEPSYTEEFNNSLFGISLDRCNMTESFLDAYIDPKNIRNVLDYGGDRGQYMPKKYPNKFVYEVSNANPEPDVKKIRKEMLGLVRWDLIMCCYVLEQLPDPVVVLDEMLHLLPAGSFLYIEVSIENIPMDVEKKTGNNIPTMHEHINFFRLNTIKTVVDKREGYSVLENRNSGWYAQILIRKNA